MSIHPYQWSAEAEQIAGKHAIDPDFVEACLRLWPDVSVIDAIAALSVVTNTYLAFVALRAMQQSMHGTSAVMDSEYAI